MRKAIQVTNQLDVEELNKLFEQGYQVESADDNGIYILKYDEKQPTFLIACDNSMVDISKSQHTVKQPHVRIEFDDIRDVPKVWLDGELIGDGADKKPLVSLKVDWNTDTATDKFKGFDVNYLDLDSNQYQMRGYHEGMVR
ncbi:hypothetical protein [Leuconostoc litchii]|uniref:Uncharacterized protein n=1 Tax=Leuconostoc litchii TaxID=1981069 RepID=A0A6P2CRA9_9LACO|nr:hypothetical protein [Leuconostoc litchii]TYC46857.1 hypothetical protein ESZ47_01570 [Leuconostoc litchii]